MNQTQDRITTPTEAELTSRIRSCLASFLEPKLAEGFLQPFGTLCMRMAEFWKAFYEDLLSTGALFTEKTTNMHDETNRTANGGKIA